MRREFSVTIDYHETLEAIGAEYWRDQSGHFDRLGDQPAVTFYCPSSGNITQLRWHSGQFPNGPHRDGDKPARIYFDRNTGHKLHEQYMKVGELHRDQDTPADIRFFKTGRPKAESYYQYGRLHRNPAQGPAVIHFDENGQVLKSEYWSNNKKLNPKSHPIPNL